MTFREAYLRTGRILSISVIPADRHSSVPSLVVQKISDPERTGQQNY